MMQFAFLQHHHVKIRVEGTSDQCNVALHLMLILVMRIFVDLIARSVGRMAAGRTGEKDRDAS